MHIGDIARWINLPSLIILYVHVFCNDDRVTCTWNTIVPRDWQHFELDSMIICISTGDCSFETMDILRILLLRVNRFISKYFVSIINH